MDGWLSSLMVINQGQCCLVDDLVHHGANVHCGVVLHTHHCCGVKKTTGDGHVFNAVCITVETDPNSFFADQMSPVHQSFYGQQ